MGRVYITGDIHGDPTRLGSKFFPEGKDLTKDDYVIILGDFGLVWLPSREDSEEKNWLDWLEDKPFTTLFVDGNHDNFTRLSTGYPTTEWHGGVVHKIRPSVIHLMRGYVFDICDKKFFAFGGASSHDIQDGILCKEDFNSYRELVNTALLWQKLDKSFRIKNLSWWEEELPSQEEMDRGIKTLEDNNYSVDYVITHCVPQEIASILSNGFYKPDSLTLYFNGLIDNGLQFTDWYAGHYHEERDIIGKFHIRYERIERIV